MKKLKNIFNHLTNNYFNNFLRESYSQEGEDRILKRIFNKNQQGFFVDVGAHHPKRFSNTYFFYKRGWRGINIDAMPGSMELFNRHRPDDINIEVPISSSEQELDYFIFNDKALNGFSKDLSEERANKYNYKIEKVIKLKTKTLNNILIETNVPTEFEFLTIDVEGLDHEVLLSFKIDHFKPKVILIELIGQTFEELQQNDSYKYLLNHNYILLAKTVNTCFFINNEYKKIRFNNEL